MSFCANTLVTETVHRRKIHPLLCLWLRNSTNHNRAKSNTHESGNEETRNRNPSIPSGET